MPYRKTGLLAVGLFFVVSAAGCGPDRFNGAGCTSDDDCRLGRVCAEGMCVDPSTLDQFIDPAPFVGGWDMRVSGTLVEPDGRTLELENQAFTVDILAGTEESDSDLIVEVGFCSLPADLTSESTFELLDRPCEVSRDETTATYQIIRGSGTLSQEGQLNFTYTGDAEINTPGQPNQSSSFDLVFEGSQP
ncbi:hypothetical protein FIV42_02665 [Persicimonas caeni]|uniref:Lipoprotein n=1 Tax=Persicimonas caeni TaxID=2292766 RepID=A0A4Y6PN83_PERCE|nr:hypothetical protein [Persicimonas caeni]QDG49679.1 hypothetical protein FIV42_02665 [Persicimonas caeni]QED30900.1 hypothetical protein FRD00_02660 [Persicimonas caeni]